jgi:hypothetical protein
VCARALVATLLVAACGEASPPAITVGAVAYTEEQLLGLTESRRQSLVELTALALAVADSSTAEVGAPLLEEWTEDRLLEILAAELTLERLGFGEGELLEEYRMDPEWELSVRHILVFSERWRGSDHRSAAESKAARALTLLGDGVDFAEVEARLAGEPGGEARAGLLPPGREGAWVPEFWAAALALEPGELSPVTETQYGYHVLRLEGRTIVPFPEARSVVARRVARTLVDPRGVLETWMAAAARDDAARRRAALAEARSRGLEVPSPEREEIERRWQDQVAQWAAALGLAYGATPTQVAAAALAALASPGQGADIARREVSAHGELLRARYDIRVGTAPSAEP